MADLKINIRSFIDCYFIDYIQYHENCEHSVYTYLKYIIDLKLENNFKKMQFLCRVFLSI